MFGMAFVMYISGNMKLIMIEEYTVMLKKSIFGALIVGLLIFAGCNDDEVYDPVPQPPQGVYSVTGDGEVYIWWNGPYDRDVAEYSIFRTTDPNGPYTEISVVPAEDNPNLDLIIYSDTDRVATNGITYYYAVASVDHAGQMSDLSAEDVFDTPRPDGFMALTDTTTGLSTAGWDFSLSDRISASSVGCDVFLDYVGGVFYLNAGDIATSRNVVLQDMGFADTFDEIGWAAQSGWSDNGWVEVILGHIYIVKTDDNHYAKLWVVDINPTSVSFAWAYQLQVGNPELVGANDSSNKETQPASITTNGINR